MDASRKSLGELQEFWEARMAEAREKLTHIYALMDTPGTLPTGMSPRRTAQRPPGGERVTVKDHLRRMVGELEGTYTQKQLQDLLAERGVKSSRQTTSVAVNALIEEGVLEKGPAPPGSPTPHHVGRPGAFGKDSGLFDGKTDDGDTDDGDTAKKWASEEERVMDQA